MASSEGKKGIECRAWSIGERNHCRNPEVIATTAVCSEIRPDLDSQEGRCPLCFLILLRKAAVIHSQDAQPLDLLQMACHSGLGSGSDPVLVDFLKRWLERNGAYEHSGEWIVDSIVGVARLPGFWPALFVLSGLLVGVWFDALLRRFDGADMKLVNLGNDLRRWGGHWQGRTVLKNSWPDNVDDLKPELLSCHLRFDKSRYRYADWRFIPAGRRAMVGGLSRNHLNELLSEHRFAQAEQNALGVKQALSIPVNPTVTRFSLHHS